jgi:hypothetical protein
MTEGRRYVDIALPGESVPVVHEVRPAAGLAQRLMDDVG